MNRLHSTKDVIWSCNNNYSGTDNSIYVAVATVSPSVTSAFTCVLVSFNWILSWLLCNFVTSAKERLLSLSHLLNIILYEVNTFCIPICLLFNDDVCYLLQDLKHKFNSQLLMHPFFIRKKKYIYNFKVIKNFNITLTHTHTRTSIYRTELLFFLFQWTID